MLLLSGTVFACPKVQVFGGCLYWDRGATLNPKQKTLKPYSDYSAPRLSH